MQRKVSAHAYQKEIAYQKKSEGKCVNNIKTENLVLSEWKHCPNSAQKNQESNISACPNFHRFCSCLSAQEWKSTSLEKQRW
jgi:hypothetical protein